MNTRNLILIHALILAVLWAMAFMTSGVGGGGDSLTHYFISELAWTDSYYFFDQWGKPFFTLFTSPWAQAGFIGMKLFNTLCGVLASLMACLTARELKKDWFLTVPFLAFIAPAFFSYLFSGLTEPFAALVSITSVWLCLSGRVNTGFFLAGFLPFCRSEAQVFLFFFLVFGLLNGHWKKLPMLLMGYLIYSLCGLLYFDDILWAFQSPYDSQGSVYGHGVWYHYLERLSVMLGIPGIALLALGGIQFFRRWWLKEVNWKTEPWMVHGPFTALVAAHSLVWTLGIYGSAGLERTLVTAFPFVWIIMLDGVLLLRDLSGKIRPSWSLALPSLALALQLVYFLTNPQSKGYWQVNMNLSAEDMLLRDEVGTYIKANYPQVNTFVIDKPFMAVALDINFKNPEQRQPWFMYNKLEQLDSATTLFLYDSYYVSSQYNISLEQIRKDEKLVEIKQWEASGWEFILFQRANSATEPVP